MPREIVSRFDIFLLKILDEEGNCDDSLKPELSDNQVKELFELMILSRAFDDVALKLQREGRIGTYASARGQEAAQVASVYALKSSDWMFPSFRENPAYIAMGLPIEMLYEYWGGDERGNQIPQNLNAFTVAIPVGTQIPHAVGFAWAVKLKRERRAVLVYFGDGATSKGDFHEALNFAGIFKVPIVFVCENNQWAISVPRSRQSASKTLAQKALAYGFEGIQVDGNDAFAVYKATEEALEKARSGNGPTMIECVTYRMADHTTSDDASRYRSKEELEAWSRLDPVDRLRKYLQHKGLWNDDYEKRVQAEAMVKVQQAVQKAESINPQGIRDLFLWTYAELPAHLKIQYEELSQYRKDVE